MAYYGSMSFLRLYLVIYWIGLVSGSDASKETSTQSNRVSKTAATKSSLPGMISKTTFRSIPDAGIPAMTPVAETAKNTFTIGPSDEFHLNGEVFRLYGGGIHYFRVPEDLWRDRLLRAKALGLNTIDTYIAWNIAELELENFDLAVWNKVEKVVREADGGSSIQPEAAPNKVENNDARPMSKRGDDEDSSDLDILLEGLELLDNVDPIYRLASIENKLLHLARKILLSRKFYNYVKEKKRKGWPLFRKSKGMGLKPELLASTTDQHAFNDHSVKYIIENGREMVSAIRNIFTLDDDQKDASDYRGHYRRRSDPRGNREDAQQGDAHQNSHQHTEILLPEIVYRFLNDLSVYLPKYLKFVRLVSELGMYLLLRPGPYICGEWDFGGLPGRLGNLATGQLRTFEQTYITEVDRYFSKLLPPLRDELFINMNRDVMDIGNTNQGGIILLQLEDEYGTWGDGQNIPNDRKYLYWLLLKMIAELMMSMSGNVVHQSPSGTRHSPASGVQPVTQADKQAPDDNHTPNAHLLSNERPLHKGRSRETQKEGDLHRLLEVISELGMRTDIGDIGFYHTHENLVEHDYHGTSDISTSVDIHTHSTKSNDIHMHYLSLWKALGDKKILNSIVESVDDNGHLMYHYYDTKDSSKEKRSVILETLLYESTTTLSYESSLPSTLSVPSFFTVDPGDKFNLSRGGVDFIYKAADFGPNSNSKQSFHIMKELNLPGRSPNFNAAYYVGWLTHVGDVGMAQRTARELFNQDKLRSTSTSGISPKDSFLYLENFALYVIHGGTDFGLSNGALDLQQSNSKYRAQPNSYDYHSPISEDGRHNVDCNGEDKYVLLREGIMRKLIGRIMESNADGANLAAKVDGSGENPVNYHGDVIHGNYHGDIEEGNEKALAICKWVLSIRGSPPLVKNTSPIQDVSLNDGTHLPYSPCQELTALLSDENQEPESPNVVAFPQVELRRSGFTSTSSTSSPRISTSSTGLISLIDAILKQKDHHPITCSQVDPEPGLYLDHLVYGENRNPVGPGDYSASHGVSGSLSHGSLQTKHGMSGRSMHYNPHGPHSPHGNVIDPIDHKPEESNIPVDSFDQYLLFRFRGVDKNKVRTFRVENLKDRVFIVVRQNQLRISNATANREVENSKPSAQNYVILKSNQNFAHRTNNSVDEMRKSVEEVFAKLKTYEEKHEDSKEKHEDSADIKRVSDRRLEITAIDDLVDKAYDHIVLAGGSERPQKKKEDAQVSNRTPQTGPSADASKRENRNAQQRMSETPHEERFLELHRDMHQSGPFKIEVKGDFDILYESVGRPNWSKTVGMNRKGFSIVEMQGESSNGSPTTPSLGNLGSISSLELPSHDEITAHLLSVSQKAVQKRLAEAGKQKSTSGEGKPDENTVENQQNHTRNVEAKNRTTSVDMPELWEDRWSVCTNILESLNMENPYEKFLRIRAVHHPASPIHHLDFPIYTGEFEVTMHDHGSKKGKDAPSDSHVQPELQIQSEVQKGSPPSTHLDLSLLNRGIVFINSITLGRYWSKQGPQRTMYIPSSFLKFGKNKIQILDLGNAVLEEKRRRLEKKMKVWDESRSGVSPDVVKSEISPVLPTDIQHLSLTVSNVVKTDASSVANTDEDIQEKEAERHSSLFSPNTITLNFLDSPLYYPKRPLRTAQKLPARTTATQKLSAANLAKPAENIVQAGIGDAVKVVNSDSRILYNYPIVSKLKLWDHNLKMSSFEKHATQNYPAEDRITHDDPHRDHSLLDDSHHGHDNFHHDHDTILITLDNNLSHLIPSQIHPPHIITRREVHNRVRCRKKGHHCLRSRSSLNVFTVNVVYFVVSLWWIYVVKTSLTAWSIMGERKKDDDVPM